MKKMILLLITAVIMLLPCTLLVYASNIDRGNPAAIYSHDRIFLPNGNEVALNENPILLFLNGTLITDYEIIIRNDRVLVPLRLIAQELDSSVEWDGSGNTVIISKAQSKIILTIDSDAAFINGVESALDYPAIIYNESMYVPLRFVAENLDASVEYSSRLSPEFTYYYDTLMPMSPARTIIRDFTNVIIDEKYDFTNSATAEEAMIKTQAKCLEGLESFSKGIIKSLTDSNENPDRLDDELEGIKMEINRMLYIGDVSRFYKFTIGPYDILYDRLNEKIFFIIYSSGTIVKELDINDNGLYIPVFIVG